MAERCPTCGSGKRERDTGISYCCTDSWHGVASEPAPTSESEKIAQVFDKWGTLLNRPGMADDWPRAESNSVTYNQQDEKVEPTPPQSAPLHDATVKLVNSVLEARVPESAFLGDEAEPAPKMPGDADYRAFAREMVAYDGEPSLDLDKDQIKRKAEPAVERPTEPIQALRGLEYVSYSQAQQAATLLDEAESELSSLREKLRLFGLRESDLNAVTREELAEKYKAESGKKYHTSDCATSVAPAEAPGPCDCISPALNDPELTVRDLTVAELESELSSLRQQVEDYKQTLEDKRRLTRELDIALNGEDGAAK